MTQIFIMNISGIDDVTYRMLYDRSSQLRQQQADRYLRQEDRVRCICAGQLLRFALGTRDFAVETNAYGKPFVKERPDIHYNLSHSGDWVVIAYGQHPVGIDLEKIEWDPGKEKLARRYFTADEQDFVFCHSQQGIENRFFEIWTSKEAYLKYLGTGLRKALDSFSVLQLDFPKRFTIHGAQYSLSLWTEEGAYDLKTITISDLLALQN